MARNSAFGKCSFSQSVMIDGIRILSITGDKLSDDRSKILDYNPQDSRKTSRLHFSLNRICQIGRELD